MDKKNLVEIFKEIGHFGEDIGCNDKNGTHTYLETYDKLFEPFRRGSSIMEIGLAMGDSLKLWDAYFENSIIVGVDISIVFEPIKYKNQVQIFCADATKELPITGEFDIIIDDGSHMEDDQVKTFLMLKSKMRKNGLYIIEDILSIDTNRKRFEALHDNCEIIDMRDNGRFDNVLIIYKF